jgi:hypothetical protein
MSSKPRLFKFTTSNIGNLKNRRTFLLQIVFIYDSSAIAIKAAVISYNFLILMSSKPRFFKFTTSNIGNLKNR